jgi:hypothetical protein
MWLKSDSIGGLWAPGGQGLNLLHLLTLAHSSGPSHPRCSVGISRTRSLEKDGEKDGERDTRSRSTWKKGPWLVWCISKRKQKHTLRCRHSGCSGGGLGDHPGSQTGPSFREKPSSHLPPSSRLEGLCLGCLSHSFTRLGSNRLATGPEPLASAFPPLVPDAPSDQRPACSQPQPHALDAAPRC